MLSKILIDWFVKFRTFIQTEACPCNPYKRQRPYICKYFACQGLLYTILETTYLWKKHFRPSSNPGAYLRVIPWSLFLSFYLHCLREWRSIFFFLLLRSPLPRCWHLRSLVFLVSNLSAIRVTFWGFHSYFTTLEYFWNGKKRHCRDLFFEIFSCRKPKKSQQTTKHLK